MLHSFVAGVAKVIVLSLVFILSLAGFAPGSPAAQAPAQSFGDTFNPTGGGTYYLQSTISSTQNTITLTGFTEPGSGIAYTMPYLNSSIEYGTIAPQTSQSEFISFTGITQNADGSAILTGVVRGLGRSYPYTASSTLATGHAGQTRFILSNPPQLTNTYLSKVNNETVAGTDWFTIPPLLNDTNASSTAQAASRQFVLNTAIQGAGTSTESSMGISVLTPSSVVGMSTASTTRGAPYVLQNKFATTTPGLQCTGGSWNCIPVANTSGKVSQGWLDLTQFFNFTYGLFATNASSTNATTTNQYIKSIASSVLKTDANGQVLAAVKGTDYAGAQFTFATTTAIRTGGGNADIATSTFISLPANTLTASSTVRLEGFVDCTNSSACGLQLRVKVASLWTTLSVVSCTSDGTNVRSGSYVLRVMNQSVLSSQINTSTCTIVRTGTTYGGDSETSSGTSAVDLSQATLWAVVMTDTSSGGLSVLDNYTLTIQP